MSPGAAAKLRPANDPMQDQKVIGVLPHGYSSSMQREQLMKPEIGESASTDSAPGASRSKGKPSPPEALQMSESSNMSQLRTEAHSRTSTPPPVLELDRFHYELPTNNIIKSGELAKKASGHAGEWKSRQVIDLSCALLLACHTNS